jgi:hypothetical protein
MKYNEDSLLGLSVGKIRSLDKHFRYHIIALCWRLLALMGNQNISGGYSNARDTVLNIKVYSLLKNPSGFYIGHN